MKTIDTLSFQNKRALVRVDFNVPLNDAFEVTDRLPQKHRLGAH
jgi:phosphoglycerate kinase